MPDLKTVLIADDDAFIREDIVDLLSDFGCELLQTATASETFDIASARAPISSCWTSAFPIAAIYLYSSAYAPVLRSQKS